MLHQGGKYLLAFSQAAERMLQRVVPKAYGIAGSALRQARQVDGGDLADARIATRDRRLGVS